MTTAGLRRSQARGLRETGPDGTGVAQVVPEGSEALQQGPELTIGPGLARPGREPAGRQRRDPAPRIGEGAACDLGLSAERGVVLEQGRPIVVDEHLQRHAELAAVGEHRLMVLRDARRARVQVEVGLPIPLHPLARIRLRDRVPRADRPDAASRPVTRFEDGALVAGSLELVGGRHPGDAGPEHGDPDASTGILRQASRPAVGDRGSDDPHRAQGAVQRGRATIPADQVEEPSAVDSRHASVASGDIVSQSPTIQGTLLHALPAASPRGRAIMPPPRTAAPLNVPVPRPDTTRLQRLAHSYRAAAALMAAVELGLFTRVARGADTEAAVAQALDLAPTNAERLVTACVALGLLVREGDRLHNAPDVARFLVEGEPTYPGPWMLFSKPDWNEWGRLAGHLGRRDAVGLGKYAHGFTVEQARKYHEATYSIGMGAARRFARQVDLAGRRQILDLGGGSGCYCIVAAQQHPELRAIVRSEERRVGKEC